ncbi:hypothetical protein KIN20_023828 [Parelaphostrongylus tenuis]|uniref:Uncharacterized protein n=1 Tax=Parelaphostrongylus tenuis TaxID=148309 RepID=A0AAD5NAF9_PARTN|nr:hypothetical protein KIN20_023828 [Parelaphostrongylus tenuis]
MTQSSLKCLPIRISHLNLEIGIGGNLAAGIAMFIADGVAISGLWPFANFTVSKRSASALLVVVCVRCSCRVGPSMHQAVLKAVDE